MLLSTNESEGQVNNKPLVGKFDVKDLSPEASAADDKTNKNVDDKIGQPEDNGTFIEDDAPVPEDTTKLMEEKEETASNQEKPLKSINSEESDSELDLTKTDDLSYHGELESDDLSTQTRVESESFRNQLEHSAIVVEKPEVGRKYRFGYHSKPAVKPDFKPAKKSESSDKNEDDNSKEDLEKEKKEFELEQERQTELTKDEAIMTKLQELYKNIK